MDRDLIAIWWWKAHSSSTQSAVLVRPPLALCLVWWASHIDAGRAAPDTRLPSEAELAVQYGVARVTVRRALEQLRERGKVVIVHGRGTYVAPRP